MSRRASKAAAKAAPTPGKLQHHPQLAYLLSLDPALLERTIDVLIAILDSKSGDADCEPEPEGRCDADDDIGTGGNTWPLNGEGYGIVTEDDEDDDPAERAFTEAPKCLVLRPGTKLAETPTGTMIIPEHSLTSFHRVAK